MRACGKNSIPLRRTILFQDKKVIEETVNVISNDTQSKDGNARFNPVPEETLILSKNVDEAVVILTRKLFTSVSFSFAN